MRGIKIPQYEFALKLQGGLTREEGGVFAGHYSMCLDNEIALNLYPTGRLVVRICCTEIPYHASTDTYLHVKKVHRNSYKAHSYCVTYLYG